MADKFRVIGHPARVAMLDAGIGKYILLFTKKWS
jgi:hypothetical protein